MILIPRPAPHLPRTQAALQAAGHTHVHALALSHPQALPAHAPATATALMFTSPLGVQAGLPNLPAYCVGDATAAEARAQGYTVVYTGTNNGETMAHDLAPLPPQHFAHLHGDHAGLLWHTPLRQAGHTVTPVLAYRTHRIETLPQATLQTLATQNATLVTLLFSAGSARHLANLMKQANMPLSGTVIALSPAVAQAAAHWPQVITAPIPTLEGMLQALPAPNTEH